MNFKFLFTFITILSILPFCKGETFKAKSSTNQYIYSIGNVIYCTPTTEWIMCKDGHHKFLVGKTGFGLGQEVLVKINNNGTYDDYRDDYLISITPC